MRDLIGHLAPGTELYAVLLAMGLGAALGLERELAGKPAGLRTNMLVAGAAALLVGLSDVLVERFGASVQDGAVRADPIRIIEAVITGVSFLGAGTIIRRRSPDQVEGLTTAASLLFAAAIGVCVAVSEEVLAVLVTAVVLMTLRWLGRLEAWVERRVAVRAGEGR